MPDFAYTMYKLRTAVASHKVGDVGRAELAHLGWHPAASMFAEDFGGGHKELAPLMAQLLVDHGRPQQAAFHRVPEALFVQLPAAAEEAGCVTYGHVRASRRSHVPCGLHTIARQCLAHESEPEMLRDGPRAGCQDKSSAHARIS